MLDKKPCPFCGSTDIHTRTLPAFSNRTGVGGLLSALTATQEGRISEWQIKNRDESIEKAQEEIKWLRGMLKEHVQEQIVHCKDCKYGLYTGTEYHCDKHSGHENRLGEDQYYKEWHNGNWFCADGERR